MNFEELKQTNKKNEWEIHWIFDVVGVVGGGVVDGWPGRVKLSTILLKKRNEMLGLFPEAPLSLSISFSFSFSSYSSLEMFK